MPDADTLDPELFAIFQKAVAAMRRPDLNRIANATPSSTFAELGFDSLGVVELSGYIEDVMKIVISDEDLLTRDPRRFTLGEYFSLLHEYLPVRATIPA
jgi:acyl carrier protein